MHNLTKSFLYLTVLLIAHAGMTQDSSKLDRLISFPDKFFGALDKKTSSIEGKLDRQTDKYLNKIQKAGRSIKEKALEKRFHPRETVV